MTVAKTYQWHEKRQSNLIKSYSIEERTINWLQDCGVVFRLQ